MYVCVCMHARVCLCLHAHVRKSACMYSLITPTPFMATGLKFFFPEIYDVYHLREWRKIQHESKNYFFQGRVCTFNLIFEHISNRNTKYRYQSLSSLIRE